MGVLVVVVAGQARSSALSSHIIRLLEIAQVRSPGHNDVRPSDGDNS